MRTMGYTDEDIQLVTVENLKHALTVGGRQANDMGSPEMATIVAN